jgi:hypothetical protein
MFELRLTKNGLSNVGGRSLFLSRDPLVFRFPFSDLTGFDSCVYDLIFQRPFGIGV